MFCLLEKADMQGRSRRGRHMFKTKKLLIITICSFFSSTLLASNRQLINDFLKQNIQLEKAQIDLQLAELDHEALEFKFPFAIGLGLSSTDSNLESSSTLTASNAKSKWAGLTLEKGSFWGGTFSFSSNFEKLNRGSNSAFFGGVSEVNGYTQGFSYSQTFGKNFLGRMDKNQLLVARKNIELTKVKYSAQVESGLFSFLQQLTSASLNKALIDLEISAKGRLMKRYKLVQKRVKDGLREKVDLLRTRMSVMGQDEKITQQRTELSSNIESLVRQVHASVDGSSIDKIEMNQDQFSLPTGTIDGNKNLNTLMKKIELLDEQLKGIKYLKMPEVKGTISYKTNDYSNDLGDAFSEGQPGAETDEVIFSASISMPWGFETERIKKEKQNLQVMVSRSEKEKVLKSLTDEVRIIRSEIENYMKNIDSAKRRRTLAERTLREYNNLYKLGRTELDNVIQAEEDLISTERNIVQYIAQRNIQAYKLSYYYGTLVSYVALD
jgi:outer membrane protein